MSNMIPIGFEGNHHSHILAIDLMTDSWNDERRQPNERPNRVFGSICARAAAAHPLKDKTEMNLLERFKQGDIHARDALIWANLKSVRLIAHGFKSDTPDRSDIFSEGLVGLLKSMESFKLEYQFRFESFANKGIFYGIKNFLDLYGPARICISSMRALRSAYLTFYNRYYQDNQIPPSDEQVAQALRIDAYNAAELKKSFLRPVSLDSLCDSLGYHFVMEDLIGDFSDDLMGTISGDATDNIEAILDKESLRQYVEEALANLDKREADVVRKYYGIGCDEHCLAQISAKYNMTSEGIRQILLRAIRKLRGLQGRPIRKYFYN